MPSIPLRSLVAIVASASLAAASSKHQMHDDGIVSPYVPPADHSAFIETLDPALAATMQAPAEVVEAWQDMRFGFFIHWDPSCQVSGSMSWSRKGPRPHHSSDGTVKKGIPEDVYNSQYKTFNPTGFDAEEWVQLALDAGCKYMVFTAKHHNGFCMFDSQVTDYDIMSSPFARDICAELAAACQKHGLKLSWYYSQPDWSEERYRVPFPGNDWFKQDGWQDQPWNTYLTDFLYPQLRELYTNYGTIDGVWWDGLGKHPDWWRTPELLNELRTINPDLISNHRCGPRTWRIGDYDGPENEVGRFQINRPWESCMRIGGAWGYTEGAAPHPLPDAISLLVRAAGNGGNLLLNTGPSPQGTIPDSHAQRYREMGAWLRAYGDSIYATRGGPYTPGPWGCATRGKDGTTVYLHILGDWNGSLTLPNLDATVVSARALTGGEATCAQTGDTLTVTASEQHAFNTIIALELDRPAMSVPVVESVSASHTLNAVATASSEGESSRKPAPAANVVATTAADFDQGAFVRAVWRHAANDQQPWLHVAFSEPKLVSQVQINEGKVGDISTVSAFTISAQTADGWQVVHRGDAIGHDYGVVLDTPVTTAALRFDFTKFKKHVTINAVNAY
ncbi:MAG: alpha-L-fucosidase [Planctomycetota bacterium]|jgi:alpha-L-fucosidase